MALVSENEKINLENTFSGVNNLNFTTAAFDAYDCEDLTQEIVPGF